MPSPRFPDIERETLAFWKHDDTFRASIAHREGAEEWVFYDGPPFANGLPHYGHLLTGLREGPLPAVPDDARQEGRPRLRVGHARASGRARGDEAARHHREGRDRAHGHRDLQREGARVGARVHARVGGLRHPPGALGRLRARLQDPRHRLHGVASCGRSRRSTTRASPTRATACCRTAGATRRRCRRTSCAWTTTSTRCARTRRSRSPSRWSGAKAEALGLTGVRALAWTTTPWTLPTNLALAVGPGIRYAVVPGGPGGAADVHRGRRPRSRPTSRTATCSPRTCSPATRRTSATRAPRPRRRPSRASSSAPTSRTSTTTGCSTTTRMPRPGAPQRAWRILVDDYVTTSDGTGHRPPGAGLRRGRPADHRGRRHPAHHEPRRRRTVPSAGDGCRRRAVDGRQHAARPPAAPGRAPGAPRELRALVPALLALPQPAHLQGRLELVRAGHGLQGPPDREQRADHVGARERQARAVRQVARGRPRLVDQPQPVLGLADPGVEERRPRLPARRRVRLARGHRARLRPPAAQHRGRGRPAPAVHRRPDAPEPGRPHRAEHHAPHRGCARRVVRLGVDALRAGALPVREPGVVRRALARPTSSSSTSGRRAAGSTSCTCCRRRCSTAPRSRACRATASCWAATGRRCRSRCATTRT